VRTTFHGDEEFSWGISAAVNRAARGVTAGEVLGELEGGVDCDTEADAEGDGDGSSVTVSVASGLCVARALLGSSSSRETEQPTRPPVPTSTAAVSTAMTER